VVTPLLKDPILVDWSNITAAINQANFVLSPIANSPLYEVGNVTITYTITP
jgi:hypothetical protein